jgi:hypothetical protein
MISFNSNIFQPESIAQFQGLPAAKIVNGLNITGELQSVCHGKELV